MKRILIGSAMVLCFGFAALIAQETAPPPDTAASDNNGPEYDPSRGVARISLLNGDVSVRRGDSGDVVTAALNAPVMTQDHVLTASSSRAEIQFDAANILRIGSNSEVRLNDVQYGRAQIQLALGTITFRVVHNSQEQREIDTPVVGVRPLGPGIYRITVHEDGSAEITVRAGQAEIASQKGTERLGAGNTMLVRGDVADPEFQMAAPIGADDWDRWSEYRDRQLEVNRSSQYVPQDIYGTEDLDQYGRWAQTPDYGNVWVPTVSQDWAPYREGRWVWEDWYGWTWVSNDPWGWAPYHWGRWFHGSLGWCWWPGGGFGYRHYWSPALVGFFGFGGRGGFGFGFGNIGWVPLGPHEAFHGWWGRGFYGGGFGRTTVVNNFNINSFRNARANGITSVGANEFGRHAGRFAAVNGNSIRDAGLVRGALPVTPDRSSLRFSNRQVNPGAFSQSRNTSFYGRGNGTSAARVPFEQQQRAFGSMQNGAGTQNGAGGWRSATGGTAGSASHGWSRFGEPIHGSAMDNAGRGFGSTAQSTQSSGSNGGWRRFNGTTNQSPERPSYSAPARTYQPSGSPSYGSAGSNGGSRWGGASGGSAVRISPPVVHERSAGGYSGGNAGRSAPSYSGGGNRGGGGGSAPHFSGGGGGGRSSGGSGGGGGRSSGGGGGHSSGGGSHGGGRR